MDGNNVKKEDENSQLSPKEAARLFLQRFVRRSLDPNNLTSYWKLFKWKKIPNIKVKKHNKKYYIFFNKILRNVNDISEKWLTCALHQVDWAPQQSDDKTSQTRIASCSCSVPSETTQWVATGGDHLQKHLYISV